MNIFCTCMEIFWIFWGHHKSRYKMGIFFGGAKFSIFWWVCLIFFSGSKPTVHIKKK